jgi:hypothetical protein
MKRYQHTQPATAIICGIGAIAAILLLNSIAIHPLWFPVGFLLVITWIFRSLTIEVSDTDLAWHFGSGWPRKSVPLSEISSAEPIRTSFMNGWGIHCTARGSFAQANAKVNASWPLTQHSNKRRLAK